MGLKNYDSILEYFQGKECLVDSLCIRRDPNNHGLVLQIHIMLEELEAVMTMYNVSNIKMNFCSSEFSIAGFEVIDNKNRGWSKEVRYCLNDFEDGVINLYFERYEIAPYEENADG